MRARELLEHEVLVLHLGAELGRLEQALAVPLELGDGTPSAGVARGSKPLRDEVEDRCRSARITSLMCVDEPVVLGVEDRVDGGQPDVLVDAAVAGDVVRVEQLVVVGAGDTDPSRFARLTAGSPSAILSVGTAVCAMSFRKAWPVRIAVVRLIGAAGLPSTRMSSAVPGDPSAPGVTTCGKPLGPDEIAVGVGREQRHVDHVGIGELDAEDVARLRLDDGPGRHAASDSPSRQRARSRLVISCRSPGPTHMAREEDLMRGMRRIGLVLIDERRGRVRVLVDVVRGAEDAVGAGQVGGPRQHHEVGRAALVRTADRPAASGMNTVPLPPLFTRSRPWSKNWPKKVNQELNGADRPASGVCWE